MVTVWLAAALVAAPPPLKGRPDDFSGAVGGFDLAAEIQPSKFRLDETATLSLLLKGTGDLAEFRTPDLTKQKSFADRFDVVGPPKKSVSKDGVRIDHPIRARSLEAKAVPSIRFSIYDDRASRPGYRLLRSAEIPIEVLPVPVNEIAAATAPEEPTPPSLGSWIPLAMVVFTFLLAGVLKKTFPRCRGRSVARRAGEGKAVAKLRRRRTPDPPAAFIRTDADRWIDRFGEALSLPPGRWTTREIVAASRQLPLNALEFESLKRNLSAIDASRFGRRDATPIETELSLALDAVRQASGGASTRREMESRVQIQSTWG